MSKKLTDKQKLRIYRDALANISKLAGYCWDGNRVCHDTQAVADQALDKVDPAYQKKIYDEQCSLFYVKRDGSFHKRKKESK